MNISEAYGYGAVVVPARLFWQGFVIVDPKTLAPYVGQAIAIASMAGAGDQVFGAMQAGLVETILHMRKPGMEGRSAVFASACAELSGERYFVIDATVTEAGTETRFSPLEVFSPEQAREMIEKRVMPLKMGLALKMWDKK